MIKRLLFGAGAAEVDPNRDKLTEARTKQDEESDALQKDLARLTRRSDDPIGDIIKNIRRVRRDE